MKLLLDNNLSYRILIGIVGAYPDSTHVARVGLRDQSDNAIWSYAKEHGFVIVSKDGDFAAMAKLYGPPPPVIWLRFGNCTTASATDALLRYPDDLKALIDQGTAMVEIHQPKNRNSTPSSALPRPYLP